ncbi:hypothetical protein Tco_1466191 [Tanacetum coccineum]
MPLRTMCPTEEQLLHVAKPQRHSDSHRLCVLRSDPEEDPQRRDDRIDLREDPVEYPRRRGDDAVDHAPSAEETEPFETDESAATPPPHPAYRVTARISIRDEPPTPFWSDTEAVITDSFNGLQRHGNSSLRTKVVDGTTYPVQTMIDQGVTAALAARDANRSTNGDDSHVSEQVLEGTNSARECTYPDFMKCQPLNFKGTKGVGRIDSMV